MKKPLVSVIIPTRNSAEFLERCLKSVEKQTYIPIEIIIVDRFSEDDTVRIAKVHRAKAKVFQIHASERSEQLNFGVKKADGKYIYRVDSDFILEPTIVEEAVAVCETKGFDAICVHNTSDPTVGFWARVRKLERDCYADDELNVAARFMKKSAFNTIGGFDIELVAGEDYDLHNRLLEAGYKIGRIKAKEIHLGEAKSIWEIAKKSYYYGKTLPRFLEKNKERGAKQLSIFRPAIIRNWKKFARHPILALGFIVYQFVRYASAGLGYLNGKARNEPSKA